MFFPFCPHEANAALSCHHTVKPVRHLLKKILSTFLQILHALTCRHRTETPAYMCMECKDIQCTVFTFFIPLLGEVAHHAYASRAVASAYAALVELELGADDAVAAGPHAFPFHAHRAAVWTTFGPVYHLKTRGFEISTAFFFLSIKCTVPLKEDNELTL